MFMSPYRTTVTEAHMSGKRLADCEPKAEKKYVPSDYVTPRRLKPKDYNCTEPARTRDGAKYPGGRHMRRALKNLGLRQNAFVPRSSPADHQRTVPGSMKA